MRNSYIHNFARTLQGQLGIVEPKSFDFSEFSSALSIAKAIAQDRQIWVAIGHRVASQKHSTMGELATWGEGTIAPRGDGVKIDQIAESPHWLSLAGGGLTLLINLAVVTIIAAMADNIWDQLQKTRAKADFEHTDPHRHEDTTSGRLS